MELEAGGPEIYFLSHLFVILTDHQWVAKWVGVDGSGMREREDWFRREGEGGKQRLGQRQSWGEHQGCAGGR